MQQTSNTRAVFQFCTHTFLHIRGVQKKSQQSEKMEQMTLEEASNEGSVRRFRLYLWSHLHETERNCPFRN